LPHQLGNNSGFSIDIPEATYCIYHAVDNQGRRLYRSANTMDHKVKNFHKDTFVAYLMVINKGGTTWRILRRYSSLKDFVKDLRQKESKLVEPVPFPPKKLMGDVDINKRRLALKAYFQG
jgi:hypothetical protein